MSSLLDLICPARCAGCGAPGGPVCARCAIALAATPVRHRPTPCPPGLPPTWVVATYDDATRGLLIAFKERGAVGLARPLGDALARAIGSCLEPGMPALVVPAPSARAAVRRRGDDTVRMLATRAVRRLRVAGWQVAVAPVLTQRRFVADSAGLSSPARAANLAGALMVRRSAMHRVRDARVVVVDDLVTTGVTLTEACGALTRCGAHVLGAAAVAATRRRIANW